VNTGNLDDVVAFLSQRQRNGPTTVRRDVQDHHSEAEILDFRHYFGNMLIRASNERVTNRTTLSERHQIATQLALNAFSTAGQRVDQPELKTRHLGERIVLSCPAPLRGGLVPIATEHRQTGAVPSQASEQFQQASVIPGDGVSTTRAMNRHRAIGEGIACINEERAAIHPTPSFPLTRDVTSA
jgi:hypothetical protein